MKKFFTTAYGSFHSIFAIFLLVLGCQIFSTKVATAQSFRTVAFTGSPTDFTIAEQYSATAGNVDYYITFDATTLYIAAFRTSGTFAATDNLAVYIDTDPNATPTGGVGTTAGQLYNGVSGTLPFSANYTVHSEQGFQEARSFGGTWATTIAGLVHNTGSTWREMAIPFTSIGNPNSLYLTMWCGYAGGIFANAPGPTLGAGANPVVTGYFGGFGVSSADCTPKSTINTPITDIITNGVPAAGALYGKVVINAGTITATNNFNIASGGSIDVSGASTFNISGRSIVLGGTTIGDGKGTTISTTGTAVLTTSTATNLTFNGEGNVVGNNLSTAANISINRKFTPLPTGGVTLLTGGFLRVKANAFVNTHSLTYNTGSTLSFETGGVYGVGAGDKTWGIGATGSGVPDLVWINAAGTNLQINEDRTARSRVTATSGTLTNNTNTLNIATTNTTGANALLINGGTFLNGGGTTNVGPTNGGNQSLALSSGVFTVSSGVFNINGGFAISGGTFTMSNGALNIDPNSGVLASSLPSGTDVWDVSSPAVFNVSNGTITFVDPPNAGTGLTLSYSTTANNTFTGGTVVLGGTSGTNATTATVGFKMDGYELSGRLKLFNVIINGGNLTDRYASGPSSGIDDFGIGGLLTINAGSELRVLPTASITCSGNIQNNGTLTTEGTLNFALTGNGTAITTTNTIAQTVAGAGVFRDNATTPVNNFFKLLFDNNAAAPAVTFNIGNVSINTFGSVNFKNGVIDIGSTNNINFVGTASALRTNGFLLRDGTGVMNKDFATGDTPPFTYFIGDNTGSVEYSPFTLDFSLSSIARTVGVIVVDAKHPSMDLPAPAQTNYISRYWTITNSAAGTYTYNTSIGTAGYVAADVNGIETNMKLNQWNGTTWTQLATSSAGSNLLSNGATGATQTTLPLTGDFSGRVRAAVLFTWVGGTSNNYNTGSNWDLGTVPGAFDDILINVASPNPCSINSGSFTINNITISGTGDFRMASGTSLTVSSNVTYSSSVAPALNCGSTIFFNTASPITIPAWNYGNLNLTGGNRILPSTGTVGICGVFTRGAGAYTIGTSTVDYNGTAAQTIAIGTYYNLTISNARTTNNITLGAGIIDVNNIFSPTVTFTSGIVVVTGNTINFSGANGQGIPAFFYGSITSANNSRIWANAGIIDINAGFSPGTGIQTITNSTIRYSSTVTGWGLTTFTSNIALRQYNNLIFNGVGGGWGFLTNLTIGVAGNLSMLNGTLTLATTNTTGILNVDGNVNVSGGSIRLAGNPSSFGTLNINTGNFNLSGGTVDLVYASGGTGNIFLLGSGAGYYQSGTGILTRSNSGTNSFTFKGTTGSPQIISQTGGTISSIVNITLDPLQLRTNLTTNFNIGTSATAGFNLNGGILDAGTFVISGTGGFGSNANTTLITAHASGVNGTIAVAGTKSLSFDANYVFNGTVAQVTGALVTQAKGITINNTSGLNPAVSLSASIAINPFSPPGNLTLTNGILRLDAFSLTLNAAATITGGSTTSFVQTNSTGYLVRSCNNAQSLVGYNFPVGETTNYTPFAFTAGNAGAAGNVSIRVIAGSHPNMAPATNYINRYWDILYNAAIITTGVGITAKYLVGDIVIGPETAMTASVWAPTLSTWLADAASVPGTPTALTITQTVPNATILTTGTSAQYTARAENPVYYRSITNGNWNAPSTWETSLNAGFAPILSSPATIAPNANNSLAITIRNTHTVTNLTNTTLDQTTIENGGNLFWTGSTITINNGTGDDLTINNGGVFRHAFSSPLPIINTGAIIRVNTGGAIEVTNGTNAQADGYASDQFMPNNVIWENASIFNWNTSNPFSAAGRIYFPNAIATVIPIFRISTAIGTNIGGATNTTINGVTEANATSNWANTGVKIFRNGIRGTSTITQLVGAGQFQFTGATAELNGTGTLALNVGGLAIQSGCTTTMATAGRVVTTAPTGLFLIANGGTLTVDVNLTSMNGSLQVNSGGTINCKTFTVGGSGTFANNVNGTLITGLATGVNGAITVAGLINFVNGSNYTFTGIVDQVTGVAMPAIVGILTVANTGTSPTNIVTLSNNNTTATRLNLNNGRFNAGTGGTLIMATGGIINGGGGNQYLVGTATDNIIRFTDGQIQNTPELYNITVQGSTPTTGGISFLNNARINNIFLINSAGYVKGIDAPRYAVGSTLIYNAAGFYTRNSEWGSNTPLAASYPHHVIIQNGTTLVFDNTTPLAVGCGGNLSIGNPAAVGAGTLDLSAMTTKDVYVTGSLNIGGSVSAGVLTMSNTIGGDMYLSSNWNRNANGSVNFGTGDGRAIFFEGNTDASITANGGQQFPFVYITKTAKANKITLVDNVSITDEIGFSSGTVDLAANNKFLTILSTATKTARVGQSNATNTDFIYGTGATGQFIVQRYIPARRSWRLMAAPLKPGGGTHTISEAWQERNTGLDYSTPAATTASIATDTITAAFGTQITGGTAANGFDQSPNNNTSIKNYNAGSWVATPNINATSVNSKEGWMVFYRGDRKNYGQITNQYKAPTITTLRPRGQIFIGTKAIISTGFTVVGNPYASAIDYNSIARTTAVWPANPTYYVWDPYLGGATGQGAFVTLTWNGTDFTRSSPYGVGTYDNRYIPSGAAILVDFPAGGTLTINETNKNANNTTTAFRPVRKSQLMTVLNTIHTDNSTYVSDGALSLFNENFNNNVDINDPIKMTNNAENFGLERKGKILSIERRRPVTDGDTIFYNFSKAQRKNYQLQFIMDQIGAPSSTTAFLEDKFLKIKTVVNMQDTTRVDFKITNDSSAIPDRFQLVFRRSIKSSSIEGIVIDKDILVHWKMADEFNMNYYEIERSQNGETFTNIGSKPAIGNSELPVNYQWLDISPAPGTYFYRIKSTSKNGVVDYSDKVKVKIVKASPAMYVFPNPVTDGVIQLQINNAPAAEYATSLISSNGQLIKSQQIVHTGGTATKNIQLGGVANGTYELKVTAPDKQVTTIKIFISN